MSRIVVVDDHPGYRLLVRTALAGADDLAVVAEATTAAAAVEAATRARADAALVDVSLPDADGFAVIEALHRALPGCSSVLTSAHPASDLAALGHAATGFGLLAKSTDPRRLAAHLRAALTALRAADDVRRAATATLPADRTSARAARRFVASTLEGWGLDDLVDAVQLLVSELVGNAVVHARSEVEVGVRVLGDRLRVDVADRSTSSLRRRSADADATGGRGTELVEAVAAAWGVEPRPEGKSVWFEVPVPKGAA